MLVIEYLQVQGSKIAALGSNLKVLLVPNRVRNWDLDSGNWGRSAGAEGKPVTLNSPTSPTAQDAALSPSCLPGPFCLSFPFFLLLFPSFLFSLLSSLPLSFPVLLSYFLVYALSLSLCPFPSTVNPHKPRTSHRGASNAF
jgi:hypothetical protein